VFYSTETTHAFCLWLQSHWPIVLNLITISPDLLVNFF